jgi:D-sedoheptulose 7-phosphate isomerase
MALNRAVFLDRDGVINDLVYYPEAGIIDSPFTPELFRLLPQVDEAIRRLNEAGFKVVVATNQPGIAKGHFSEVTLAEMQTKMVRELEKRGAHLDGVYYCPHHPEGINDYRLDCECRKPKPGLLLQAARELDIDLGASFMVGDSLSDIKTGQNANCHTVLIGRLKCDTCRLMDELEVKPDALAADLLSAVRWILDPTKNTEEEHWVRKVSQHLLESARIKEAMSDVCAVPVVQASQMIADSLKRGGKVMLCGNGGSAADSQHLATELVGRLSPGKEKIPMAAIALSTDTSSLTAIGNDYGFEYIFSRQIEALGRKDDVLIAISTSGRSANIVRAVKVAREIGIKTIGLLGRSGMLKDTVDLAIMVPSDDTQRIQEGHTTIGHLICETVEEMVKD